MRFSPFSPTPATPAPAPAAKPAARRRRPAAATVTTPTPPPPMSPPPATLNAATIGRIRALAPSMLVIMGKATTDDDARTWQDALCEALARPGAPDFDTRDWRLALDWQPEPAPDAEPGDHLPASAAAPTDTPSAPERWLSVWPNLNKQDHLDDYTEQLSRGDYGDCWAEVEKTVYLTPMEWEYFTSNLLTDYPWLAGLGGCPEQGVRSVVLVVVPRAGDAASTGILVDPQGYDYARYVGFYVDQGRNRLITNPPNLPAIHDVEDTCLISGGDTLRVRTLQQTVDSACVAASLLQSASPDSAPAAVPAEHLPASAAATSEAERIASAREHLTHHARLRHMIPPSQLQVTQQGLRGEEAGYFADIILRLADQISAAPRIYDQEGLGDDAIVHFHYFVGGSDWWITELDKTIVQHQCYGFVCLNGDTDCAESGYISLPELFAAAPLLNLDYHWEPCPLGEVKRRLYGRREPQPPIDEPDREALIAFADAEPTPSADHLPASAEPIPLSLSDETLADHPFLHTIAHLLAAHGLGDLLTALSDDLERWYIPAPAPDRKPLGVIWDGDNTLTVFHCPPDQDPSGEFEPDICVQYHLERTTGEVWLRHLQTADSTHTAADRGEALGTPTFEQIRRWVDGTWGAALQRFYLPGHAG